MHSGLWRREFNLLTPKGPDVHYRGAGRNGDQYFNPFDPEVARLHEHGCRLMLDAFGEYPNVRFAFIDMEHVDDLYHANANVGGKELMKRMLGFTKEEIGKPKFVASGVLADDDRGYRYHKYVFQHGNGVNLALQRAADRLHGVRPDVKLISDPYRSVALLDMFPGCDIVATWTYTNPRAKSPNSASIIAAGLILTTVQPLRFSGVLPVPSHLFSGG